MSVKGNKTIEDLGSIRCAFFDESRECDGLVPHASLACCHRQCTFQCKAVRYSPSLSRDVVPMLAFGVRLPAKNEAFKLA